MKSCFSSFRLLLLLFIGYFCAVLTSLWKISLSRLCIDLLPSNIILASLSTFIFLLWTMQRYFLIIQYSTDYCLTATLISAIATENHSAFFKAIEPFNYFSSIALQWFFSSIQAQVKFWSFLKLFVIFKIVKFRL